MSTDNTVYFKGYAGLYSFMISDDTINVYELPQINI